MCENKSSPSNDPDSGEKTDSTTMSTTTKTIFTPKLIFTSDDSDNLTPAKASLKFPTSHSSAPGKRKLSFPVTFHSTLLLSDSNAISRTTRRLSNVSDRVTDRVRKLSTAMGWTQAPSKDILISQAKFLVTLYIRFRLKRSGVLRHNKKKIGLQKMQRNMLIGADIREVFIALKEVSSRRRRVNIYRVVISLNKYLLRIYRQQQCWRRCILKHIRMWRDN